MAWWCGLGMVLAGSLRADLAGPAWRARALLGPGHWSQVVRIERARTAFVPERVLYALIFELENRLWYYAGDEGTQSLSLQSGRLEQDKADLEPLLRAVVPGLRRYSVQASGEPVPVEPGPRESLPQGCFIACVAFLQSLVADGRPPDAARLVAYYGAPSVRSPGHTVLYFEREGSRYYYDPQGGPTPVPIPDWLADDALTIARFSAPGAGHAPPKRAVFLALQVPSSLRGEWPERDRMAGGPPPRAGAGISGG